MPINYRKSVSDPMYSILILSYFVVGFLAVLGNTGVILAFCRSVKCLLALLIVKLLVQVQVLVLVWS